MWGQGREKTECVERMGGGGGLQVTLAELRFQHTYLDTHRDTKGDKKQITESNQVKVRK